MNEFPQIETMMRHVLERERAILTSSEGRVAALKEELASATRDCSAQHERIAEMERWLKQFGTP